LVGVQKFALGGVGAMPGWPKGEYGVTQRGGLRSSRCALTGVVGFRNSTGIVSDVRDVKTATATEAGAAVSWPGLFARRGGPCENQSHWSWVGRSAGRSGCPVRPVQTPKPKGSPSIPARPLLPASLRDNHPTTEPHIPQRRSDAEKSEPNEDHPAPLRENHVVQPALLTTAAGTPAVATDHAATRTGRKDSRLSGPLDPETPSAVAGPSSFAALVVHRAASFATRKTQRPTRPARHRNHPQLKTNRNRISVRTMATMVVVYGYVRRPCQEDLLPAVIQPGDRHSRTRWLPNNPSRQHPQTGKPKRHRSLLRNH